MQIRAISLSQLALALLAAYPMIAAAAPGSDSAYATDPQNTHVEDATSHGIGQVNMITCFMHAMSPGSLVNQGNYIALVDKTKCDPDSRSSASNSSSTDSGSTAANYMTSTVNSTRTSNSDPMRAKVWVDENENGNAALIYVNVSATESPSATNPYGVFRLDFCGKQDGISSCVMNGFLQADSTGISFYQIEGGGGGSNTIALQLTATGTSSGSGKLQMFENGKTTSNTFAYNSTLFLRSDTDQFGATTQQCFTRDASDTGTGVSVWRYGLYNATTGERVTRSSGFPIQYTPTSGPVVQGYLGYYGLSVPPGVTIPNGATISKVDYSSGNNPQTTNYTVTKADGRLMKYTKHTKTLQSIDQIKFNTFLGDLSSTGVNTAIVTGNNQYELYWDEAAGKFMIDGVMNCSPGSGCQTAEISPPQGIKLGYFKNVNKGVNGWSQALGGEIFIPLANIALSNGFLTSPNATSDLVTVIYRSQDLVYPSNMPASLNCLSQCPTYSTMSSFFVSSPSVQSPFVSTSFNNFIPTISTNVVHYTADTTSGLLIDSNSHDVTFTDQTALGLQPQYMQGVSTGRLVADSDLASLTCTPPFGAPPGTYYCDYKTNDLDTYYMWSTGPNNWNQFAAVKDGNGNFVTFDPPLQVNYTVPNDSTKYGSYAGKSVVLQYGGFGDLWGIPGKCVSFVDNQETGCNQQNVRYVPSFYIPFDPTGAGVNNLASDGTTNYLIKWLDREIRFATAPDCSALTLPTGITLPTSASLKNPSDSASDVYIGTKPTVTDAPRVIQGDVKY